MISKVSGQYFILVITVFNVIRPTHGEPEDQHPIHPSLLHPETQYSGQLISLSEFHGSQQLSGGSYPAKPHTFHCIACDHLTETNKYADSSYLPQKAEKDLSSPLSQELTPPPLLNQQNSPNTNLILPPLHLNYDYSGRGPSEYYNGEYQNTEFHDNNNPIIHRHVYVHELPKDKYASPNVIRVHQKPQKHVNIIFVKAPNFASQQHTEVILPEKQQQRTIVYVLVKKPNIDSSVRIRDSPPVEQPKPEVYYIRYGHNKRPVH